MLVRKLINKEDRIKVVAWIRSGAPLKQGIPLYASLQPDPSFLANLKRDPETYQQRFYQVICEMMDITIQKFYQIIEEHHGKKPAETKQPNQSGSERGQIKAAVDEARKERPVKRTFRNEWPFLSRPECPPQLKALAADKISCWERYTEAHRKLFDCSTLEECYQAAYELIENFKENRQIYEELEYYKQRGNILGIHPIFGQYRRFDELKGKKPMELYKLADKTLPHKIWRIESEIRKGDKPHLNGERERRLREVKAELAEVKRILGIE